jgi:TPR repeat protein
MKEAIRYYSLSAEQNYTYAQRDLAFLYLDGKGVPQNTKKALDLFNKLIDKNYAPIEFFLGMLYYTGRYVKKDEKQALILLNRAAKHNNPDAMNMIAWLLCEHNKDIVKAEKLINKALQLAPHNPCYIDTLGWIYYKQQKCNESLLQLKKASNLAPENAKIIDHLGDVYQALGKTKKAKAQWQKALELTKDEDIKKKIEKKLKPVVRGQGN